MPTPHRLFSPCSLGPFSLKNRLVMAPMTRSRAVEANTPNALMAEYYGQRADAGLIVTEGTSPSPNGVGYARIPGLYNEAQIEGWKLVTRAVHDRGGHIFAQLMHTGRIGHALNLPKGGEVLAPSAVVAPGTMYTDAQGPQPHPEPRAMTEAEVERAVVEYVAAAKNARAAGFDGVELHGANGYLIEQFLSPHTNLRDDAWGGSIEKRRRFAIEVARRVAAAIGPERVGIRLSPYGLAGGMQHYPEIDEAYLALVAELGKLDLAYLHVVDHSALGAPPVPESLKLAMRRAWPKTFILAGGFDRATAEKALDEDRADLIAFARPFLANPDLVSRLARNAPLNAPDMATFYTPGPKGYTDYPAAL